MSESSEKKLLRDMLLKLKKKAMKAQSNYLDDAIYSAKEFSELGSLLAKMVELGKTAPEKLPDHLNEFRRLFNMVKILDSTCKIDSIRVLDDMMRYISSLEEYSKELDNTLKENFEAAKEEMEKLETKRKELEKRHPEYVK